MPARKLPPERQPAGGREIPGRRFLLRRVGSKTAGHRRHRPERNVRLCRENPHGRMADPRFAAQQISKPMKLSQISQKVPDPRVGTAPAAPDGFPPLWPCSPCWGVFRPTRCKSSRPVRGFCGSQWRKRKRIRRVRDQLLSLRGCRPWSDLDFRRGSQAIVGAPISFGLGISANGTTAVGMAFNDDFNIFAYRYRNNAAGSWGASTAPVSTPRPAG